MSLASRSGGMVAAIAIAAAACAEPSRMLRVCADPNNLPFSNDKLEGFENRIAELVGDTLDARIEYVWWAQRRGFIRNTLREGLCDVVVGVPAQLEMTRTTVGIHPPDTGTFGASWIAL